MIFTRYGFEYETAELEAAAAKARAITREMQTPAFDNVEYFDRLAAKAAHVPASATLYGDTGHFLGQSCEAIRAALLNILDDEEAAAIAFGVMIAGYAGASQTRILEALAGEVDDLFKYDGEAFYIGLGYEADPVEAANLAFDFDAPADDDKPVQDEQEAAPEVEEFTAAAVEYVELMALEVEADTVTQDAAAYVAGCDRLTRRAITIRPESRGRNWAAKTYNPKPKREPRPPKDAAPVDSHAYRMDHRAPCRSDEDTSLENVTDVYGPDILKPDALRMYCDGNPTATRESLETIQKAAGRDIIVKAFRAVPGHVDETHAGDWVTFSRSYAESHGRDHIGEGYRVLEIEAPASDFFTDGNSVNEFGYDPAKKEISENSAEGVVLYHAPRTCQSEADNMETNTAQNDQQEKTEMDTTELNQLAAVVENMNRKDFVKGYRRAFLDDIKKTHGIRKDSQLNIDAATEKRIQERGRDAFEMMRGKLSDEDIENNPGIFVEFGKHVARVIAKKAKAAA